MKKPLLILLTILILGFLGYWGLQMFSFTKEVKEDAQQLESPIDNSVTQMWQNYIQIALPN